jgi:hypothetical protein
MEVNILEFCFGGVVLQQLPLLVAGVFWFEFLNCPPRQTKSQVKIVKFPAETN